MHYTVTPVSAPAGATPYSIEAPCPRAAADLWGRSNLDPGKRARVVVQGWGSASVRKGAATLHDVRAVCLTRETRTIHHRAEGRQTLLPRGDVLCYASPALEVAA